MSDFVRVRDKKLGHEKTISLANIPVDKHDEALKEWGYVRVVVDGEPAAAVRVDGTPLPDTVKDQAEEPQQTGGEDGKSDQTGDQATTQPGGRKTTAKKEAN